MMIITIIIIKIASIIPFAKYIIIFSRNERGKRYSNQKKKTCTHQSESIPMSKHKKTTPRLIASHGSLQLFRVLLPKRIQPRHSKLHEREPRGAWHWAQVRPELASSVTRQSIHTCERWRLTSPNSDLSSEMDSQVRRCK